jgi:glucosamine-6-phosphate deaminase
VKVLIFQDVAQAEAYVAANVLGLIEQRRNPVLGLATGGTMERVYARIVQRAQAQQASFTQVRSFNLDEYWGVGPDHPCSYTQYMRTHLFAPLTMDPSRTQLPNGAAPDAEAEAARYEAAIADAGGIDLQLLGIGKNGHIGFNEPTSSLGSRTRLKTLTQSTRDANRRYFDNAEDVPRFALTMGIATILEARQVLLLANGAAKSRAVAHMIEGPLAAICPASALQLHPKVTIVLDAAAAADLALGDY